MARSRLSCLKKKKIYLNLSDFYEKSKKFRSFLLRVFFGGGGGGDRGVGIFGNPALRIT